MEVQQWVYSLDMSYIGPDLCKGMTDSIFHELG